LNFNTGVEANFQKFTSNAGDKIAANPKEIKLGLLDIVNRWAYAIECVIGKVNLDT
jgi:hypothetical protein